MTEAAPLGDLAVDDERRRLIARLVSSGDNLEILAERLQIRGRRILHVAHLDDVVDAFADEDLGGTRFDRNFRLVVGACPGGEQEQGHGRQAGDRTMTLVHYQSFSTGTLPKRRAFILRSRSRFSCCRSRTLRSASSIRSREISC